MAESFSYLQNIPFRPTGMYRKVMVYKGPNTTDIFRPDRLKELVVLVEKYFMERSLVAIKEEVFTYLSSLALGQVGPDREHEVMLGLFPVLGCVLFVVGAKFFLTFVN